MDNKVLIKLLIPELNTSYDVFIPINIRIGTAIKLLNEILKELIGGDFIDNNSRCFYNSEDASKYSINSLIRDTNIRNGSVVVFA